MLKHREGYEDRSKVFKRNHWRLALVAGLIGASAGEVQADVIKMESFEMNSPAETYTDPMDPGIDHFLTNQPDQALVAYEGWSARYRNTRNGVGLTDGDVFGVGQSGPSTWADGQQGYRLNDTDRLYQRFPGVEGSAYLVAGMGVNYQRADGITLAPIRSGVGLRAGANVGYLAYSRQRNWIPF